MLHKTGKCWCKEEHSESEVAALHMRDTTPREYPVCTETPFEQGPKGRRRTITCSCDCSYCKGDHHKKCKSRCGVK